MFLLRYNLSIKFYLSHCAFFSCKYTSGSLSDLIRLRLVSEDSKTLFFDWKNLVFCWTSSLIWLECWCFFCVFMFLWGIFSANTRLCRYEIVLFPTWIAQTKKWVFWALDYILGVPEKCSYFVLTFQVLCISLCFFHCKYLSGSHM